LHSAALREKGAIFSQSLAIKKYSSLRLRSPHQTGQVTIKVEKSAERLQLRNLSYILITKRVVINLQEASP